VKETHPNLRAIVEASRGLGADESLVLHGGGHTSAKGTITDVLGRERNVIWIKGSGWDLGTIEAAGFPACDLDALRSLRTLQDMSDEVMVREVGSP
jgi:rhamnose utilization protein RhaD (predicted bifunctional aldolase and dehydrogenase)